MKWEEWWEKSTERGTSGDMVMDILSDWKEEKTNLLTHIKELEEGIEKVEERLICPFFDKSTTWEDAFLIEHLRELKEWIEKVLKWRNLDGDGISDPLRKELYKLLDSFYEPYIKKEK